MAPIRIDVKDKEGDWNFASYAYNDTELAELLKIAYYDSRVRIYDRGVLCWERNGKEIIDFTVN